MTTAIINTIFWKRHGSFNKGVNIIEMLNEILIPLVAVGLAEMGDKTQLSILLLSSRTREYFRLLLGVVLAFLVVDGTAILLGAWITNIVPANILKLISAAAFIGFGLLMLFKNIEEEEGEASFKVPLISGFTMIFLSEWGDKTQITSALFACEVLPLDGANRSHDCFNPALYHSHISWPIHFREDRSQANNQDRWCRVHNNRNIFCPFSCRFHCISCHVKKCFMTGNECLRLLTG